MFPWIPSFERRYSVSSDTNIDSYSLSTCQPSTSLKYRTREIDGWEPERQNENNKHRVTTASFRDVALYHIIPPIFPHQFWIMRWLILPPPTTRSNLSGFLPLINWSFKHAWDIFQLVPFLNNRWSATAKLSIFPRRLCGSSGRMNMIDTTMVAHLFENALYKTNYILRRIILFYWDDPSMATKLWIRQ